MTDKAHLSLIGGILRGAGAVILGNSFSKVCITGFELLLARELGASEFGLFSIGFSMLVFASGLCILGLDFGIIQYLAVYTEEKQYDKRLSVIRLSLWIVGLVGIAAGVMVALTANIIASKLFNKPELAGTIGIVGLIIPIEAFNHCMSAIFRGLRKFSNHIIVYDLARNFVLVASAPALLIFHLPLESVLHIFLVGSLMGLVYGIIILSKQFSLFVFYRVDWNIVKQLFQFSYLLFLVEVIKISTPRLLVLVGGIFLNSTDVGALSVVMRFITILNALQAPLNRTIHVEFARLYHLGNYDGLSRLFQDLCLGLAGLSLIFALPILVQPSTVMKLYNQNFVPYGWVVYPLITAKLLNVAVGPISQLLISCHRQATVFALTLVEVALVFMIVVPLMWLYGLVGVVFAESGRVVFLVILRHLVLFRSLQVQTLTFGYAILCTIGLISVCAGFYVSNHISGFSGYSAGLGTAVLCLGVFLAPVAYAYKDTLGELWYAVSREGRQPRND
jgi:O-antigen/teichoic acid export membrane protein